MHFVLRPYFTPSSVILEENQGAYSPGAGGKQTAGMRPLRQDAGLDVQVLRLWVILLLAFQAA